MPTINFQLADFEGLLRKRLTEAELHEVLHFAKAELKHLDREGECTVALADTNQPYLWSVEGLARLLRGVLGLELGLPRLKPIKEERFVIKVARNIAAIRPWIAAFVARGREIDDYLLRQLIQAQEKLSESYGRKRAKLSIGIYNAKRIEWPLSYEAVRPESVAFIPLDFERQMSMRQIVAEHPKGRLYGHLIAHFTRWPIFRDASHRVLSFPPIINSAWAGKVQPGDSELLFEVTGIDRAAVELATSILAQNAADRAFKIFAVRTDYHTGHVWYPRAAPARAKVVPERLNSLLGLKLSRAKISALLKRMRFGVRERTVLIPSYRADIMHEVDLVEEIAIAYGYDRLGELPLTSYTPGSTTELNQFVDKLRALMIGLGCQEILSPILSNKATLYKKMAAPDPGTIELSNPRSEFYSCLRSSILPGLLELLSKNRHADFPQNVFEEGLVVSRRGAKVFEKNSLAAALCHAKADYTGARQIVDALLGSFGLKAEVRPIAHPSFIPGRVGEIMANRTRLGLIGEIAPKVLLAFDIGAPVAAFELDVSAFFEKVKKA